MKVKQIKGLIELLNEKLEEAAIRDYLDGSLYNKVFYRQQFTILSTSAYRFNLYNWLDENFPSDDRDVDKGFSVEVEVFYHFNHYYEDTTGQSVVKKHYAGTYQKKVRFSVFKSRIKSAQWYQSNIIIDFQKGLFVEYNSNSSLYYSILNSGELNTLTSDGVFPISIEQENATQLDLIFENALTDNGAFDVNPKYVVSADMRLTVMEASNDDHTIEIIK